MRMKPGRLLWRTVRNKFVGQDIRHNAHRSCELEGNRATTTVGQFDEKGGPALGWFRFFAQVGSTALLFQDSALVLGSQGFQAKVARVRISGLPKFNFGGFVFGVYSNGVFAFEGPGELRQSDVIKNGMIAG